MTQDEEFQNELIACRNCPRLVEWRETVAREKTKRFMDDVYWGKPVPSFGSADAELLIVGLAPAAHGANRTGRMFTGDRSGEWLYDALYRFGFATRGTSIHVDDGLELKRTRITAIAHCAPPQNKLTKEEIVHCDFYLRRELRLCSRVRVILALGGIAYTEMIRLCRQKDAPRIPKFAHGIRVALPDTPVIIGSYHPSQQNTFTGRLTKDMFDQVFAMISGELRKNS